MTPQQADVIAAGVAVRGWPQPYKAFPRPWENSFYVVWLWPAHQSCPPKYCDAVTGEPQEIHCGMVFGEDDDAGIISDRFFDVDASFALDGFNPAIGTFTEKKDAGTT